MEINYTDGASEERQVLNILNQATDLRSTTAVGAAQYDTWSVRYHLCPERANLVRHLDFSGLDVLELGAGMGAVSRYLAESAHSLTVVEGTKARFDALSARLRDLTNWTGHVQNIQDVRLDRKFDAVCLIGVLEYSERFVTPPARSGLSPFDCVLRQVREHLKPGGVLVLAIENKLGLKYWAGVHEDHSVGLFDGICGYPLSRSAKTFSRQELGALLRKNGFPQIDEYYPFPDYKVPTTVLSKTLVDVNPQLAAELAGTHPTEGYTAERLFAFSEQLALHSTASAGLLPEFSNSFLFVASSDAASPVRARVLGPARQGRELAWHYSASRKRPMKTVFQQVAQGIEIRKERAEGPEVEDFSDGVLSIRCQAVPPSRPTRGLLARTRLFSRLQFREWELFEAELVDFLRWSIDRWSAGAQGGELQLQGSALDAMLHNAIVTGEAGGKASYTLFDLEWSTSGDMPASWFVFRSVASLARDMVTLAANPHFPNLRAIYEKMCAAIGVPSQYERDLEFESRLQALATRNASVEHWKGVHRHMFELAFRDLRFRRPAALGEIAVEVAHLRAVNADLERRLGSFRHRLVEKGYGALKRVPVLFTVLRATGLGAAKVLRVLRGRGAANVKS